MAGNRQPLHQSWETWRAIEKPKGRGHRARHPLEANQGTLSKTMGSESDEQMTLPTRTLQSPGQPSVEERAAHEMHHLPYRLLCPECVEARCG